MPDLSVDVVKIQHPEEMWSDFWKTHKSNQELLQSAVETNAVDELRSVLSQQTGSLDEHTYDTEDDRGCTLLHLAAINGSLECAELLLDHGASLNATTTVQLMTPLHLTARQHNLALTRLLMERGAELSRQDAEGATPLHFATETGDLSLLELLLEACELE